MTQYHHLDESGNWGLGQSQGVTRYLILAMVQIAHNDPLPELAIHRREFHLPSDFEIKYYRAKPKQKESFFKEIESINFRVRAAVIDKKSLGPAFARMNHQDFAVELISRLVLRASELDIANDVMMIDAGTDALCRALRIKLSHECKKTKRTRPFSKIVGGRSQQHDGLQLADMLAGAIMHYAMRHEEEYFMSFRHKVSDLWWVRSDGT